MSFFALPSRRKVGDRSAKVAATTPTRTEKGRPLQASHSENRSIEQREKKGVSLHGHESTSGHTKRLPVRERPNAVESLRTLHEQQSLG